jgi:cytochrome c oxidase subunit 2
MRVVAQTQADFDKWVAAQRVGLSGAAAAFVDENLKELNAKNQHFDCTRCHAFDGVENAGVRTGPNLTHLGDRSTFASGIYETSVAKVAEWVLNAPHLKSFGKLNNHMPAFVNDGMSEATAQKIAHFLVCDTETAEGQASMKTANPDVYAQHQKDCS